MAFAEGNLALRYRQDYPGEFRILMRFQLLAERKVRPPANLIGLAISFAKIRNLRHGVETSRQEGSPCRGSCILADTAGHFAAGQPSTVSICSASAPGHFPDSTALMSFRTTSSVDETSSRFRSQSRCSRTKSMNFLPGVPYNERRPCHFRLH